MVSREESSVDFDARDGAGCYAETDNDPVEGGGVVTASFPAVVPGAGIDHFSGLADGWGGGDEVEGFGEPFVGEGEDFPSKRGGD